MELTHVGFDYDVKGKSLKRTNYAFDLFPRGADKETIPEIARESMERLGKVLDNLYSRRWTTKQDFGNVNSTSIEKGANYYSFSGKGVAKLFYSCYVGPEGLPENLNLTLFSWNPRRNLDIHDSILEFPDLKVSGKAQVQLDRIMHLRNNVFEFKNYLDLN